MGEKKFYWLKLKKDFFKRHDIRIVEDMPNGKDYILFYLKMLVESVDHEGELRFSESIPYNEQMLATITNTNPDIVRAAMQVFTSLNMIEVLDNDTIYMTEVHKMIGSAVDSDNANRQRRCRDRKKAEILPERDTSVTKCHADVTECVTKNNESKRKSKSKEIESEKEVFIPAGEKNFYKPSIEEVVDYCESRHNGINPQLFYDYYSARGWYLGNDPVRDWQALLRTWENNPKIKEWE